MKTGTVVKILLTGGVVLCAVIILYNALYRPYKTEMVTKVNEFRLDNAEQENKQEDVSYELKKDAQKPSDEKSSQGLESAANNDPVFDLNTVTAAQLCEIPNIGEKTAGRIIAYRNDLGGYTNLEQIMDISGIGQGTFDKIKPYVYIK